MLPQKEYTCCVCFNRSRIELILNLVSPTYIVVFLIIYFYTFLSFFLFCKKKILFITFFLFLLSIKHIINKCGQSNYRFTCFTWRLGNVFFLSINFAYPRWEPYWQRKEKLEFFQSFLHLGLTIFLSSIHFWMEKEENNVFFTHKDKNTFSYIAFHSLFRVINLNFN